MDYLRGVIKAVIPRKLKDIIAVAILASTFSYAGVKLVLDDPPKVNVYSETTYPKQAPRGGFFYLNFDLSFDRDCVVVARRLLIGSDGVEYLASEDRKEVTKDERMRYVVRVPVVSAVPLGRGFIRSDFEYGCDWWSRHIRPIRQQGRLRSVEIVADVSELRASYFHAAFVDVLARDGYGEF